MFRPSAHEGRASQASPMPWALRATSWRGLAPFSSPPAPLCVYPEPERSLFIKHHSFHGTSALELTVLLEKETDRQTDDQPLCFNAEWGRSSPGRSSRRPRFLGQSDTLGLVGHLPPASCSPQPCQVGGASRWGESAGEVEPLGCCHGESNEASREHCVPKHLSEQGQQIQLEGLSEPNGSRLFIL